jgi:hypothetical protein
MDRVLPGVLQMARNRWHEQDLKVGRNVAVVWPLLFVVDFQESASKEVVALQSYQQYLATLCGAEMCSRRSPNQHRFASAEPSSERRIGSAWSAWMIINRYEAADSRQFATCKVRPWTPQAAHFLYTSCLGPGVPPPGSLS